MPARFQLHCDSFVSQYTHLQSVVAPGLADWASPGVATHKVCLPQM